MASNHLEKLSSSFKKKKKQKTNTVSPTCLPQLHYKLQKISNDFKKWKDFTFERSQVLVNPLN
jgi:hypothetical protein